MTSGVRAGAGRRATIEGSTTRGRSMRSNLLAFSIVASLGLAQVAHAAEGMWVPQQLPEIADRKSVV